MRSKEAIDRTGVAGPVTPDSPLAADVGPAPDVTRHTEADLRDALTAITTPRAS